MNGASYRDPTSRTVPQQMTVLLRLPLLALVGILAVPFATAQGQVPGSPEAEAQFGRALAAGDFNNDGVEDLAIGSPFADVGSIDAAGSVTVLYGTDQYRYSFAMGLRPDGAQVWNQESPGILGDARAGDGFGFSLTAGDFDGDDYDDLAIGIGRATVTGLAGAGAVVVLYGSADGLTATGSQLWDQGSPGVGGGPEAGDRFGEALASGDFDRDGHDDLAIGVPGEAIGNVAQAGAVQVLYGSDQGLSADGDDFWNPGGAGIPNAAEAGDQFGFSLAVGDFDGDTTDDLAIGIPFEDIGSLSNAGAVNLLFGEVTVGLVTDGAQAINRDTPGLIGSAGASQWFGYSVAAGNLNGDPFDDLLVGTPRVNATTGSGTTYQDSGATFTIFGASGGLAPNEESAWFFTQDGARSGWSVAVGNDGAASSFLVYGGPGLTDGQSTGAGGIVIKYADASGILSAGSQAYTQNTSGIDDASEADDAYGFVVVTGDFNGDGLDDIAIGVPGEDVEGATNAGAVNVMYARPSGRLSADYDLFLHSGSAFATPVADEDPATDLASSLSPPAPNPTAGRTVLRYALAEAQDVQLVVVDLLGREVARLADGPQRAGDHEAAFDASGLPGGLYIVHLRAGDTVQTQRLTIAR